MKTPKFPIRWKLLGSFVGLALLVLLVVLFAVSRILDNRIREDIHNNFQEAGKIFGQLQEIRFRQLRQTGTLVADMPYLKAAISTGDSNTVNNQIRNELVELLHFDPMVSDTLTNNLLTTSVDTVGLVMVFDQEGNVLGELSTSDQNRRNWSDQPGIQQALRGSYPNHAQIWRKNGKYFKVITMPIYIEEQVAGALALGYPIRNQEVELLAEVIEYEVSYFVDDQLLATSVDQSTKELKTSLREGVQKAGLEKLPRGSGTTVELDIGQESWLLYVMPMIGSQRDTGGMSGHYAVAKSLDEALKPLDQLQWVIFIIGLGGILIAVILGFTLTHNLTRPINLLLNGIQRIEQEEYDQPVEVVSRDEFGQLTRTFNHLVSNIKENIREKEVLLAEIHHRVKNNLAVISGLLELEADKVKDPDTLRVIQNSRMRIHSMATIHELMYEAQNFHRLSFGDFISKMVKSIKEVYESDGQDFEIKLDVDEVQLNINRAVPCGLIINELVTNAMKHAYTEEESGPIYVSLKDKGEFVAMNVADEGKGLPYEVSEDELDSLGFKLVNILAKQLDGELNVDSDQTGTSITVEFQKQDDESSSGWMQQS